MQVEQPHYFLDDGEGVRKTIGETSVFCEPRARSCRVIA
jgi:hypothetical protein